MNNLYKPFINFRFIHYKFLTIKMFIKIIKPNKLLLLNAIKQLEGLFKLKILFDKKINEILELLTRQSNYNENSYSILQL